MPWREGRRGRFVSDFVGAVSGTWSGVGDRARGSLGQTHASSRGPSIFKTASFHLRPLYLSRKISTGLPLQLCERSAISRTIAAGHLVPFTKVHKITFHALKTAPNTLQQPDPKISSQDQPTAVTVGGRGPFECYSSRLQMFFSTIFRTSIFPFVFLEACVWPKTRLTRHVR